LKGFQAAIATTASTTAATTGAPTPLKAKLTILYFYSIFLKKGFATFLGKNI